jgi:hypothetical protein
MYEVYLVIGTGHAVSRIVGVYSRLSLAKARVTRLENNPHVNYADYEIFPLTVDRAMEEKI